MQSMQVDNLKKPELVKNGYYNVKDWLSYPENLYIGREVDYPNVYIKGSKWGNPFPLSKYTLEDCLKRYEDYVRNGKLYDELEELDGLILGAGAIQTHATETC